MYVKHVIQNIHNLMFMFFMFILSYMVRKILQKLIQQFWTVPNGISVNIYTVHPFSIST